jgi:hypothetical protein
VRFKGNNFFSFCIITVFKVKAYMTQVMHSKIRLPCKCFREPNDLAYYRKVLRDFFFPAETEISFDWIKRQTRYSRSCEHGQN